MAHGIGRRGREGKETRRQMLDALGAAVACDGQALRRRETLAIAHDGHEKRGAAGGRFAIESDHVVFPFAGCARKTKDLLAARICGFRFAELGGFANFPGAFDFDEFVNHAEIARIGGSDEGAADSEGADLRAAAKERSDFVLVEIARDEDLDVVPADAVELPTRPATVGGHVATVETHTGRLASASNDFLERGADVVGVEEKRGLLRKNIEEAVEGLRFVLESHDPGMRLRAIGGSAEKARGENIGSSCAASDEGGARSENPSLSAMRTTRTEFDNGPAFGGSDDTRGAAGNHGLKIDRGKKARFEKLGFDDGRGDAQERLVGENDGAFGHGRDFAGEAETREIIEELAADVTEHGIAADELDFPFREMDGFEKFEGLFEASGYEVIALGWKATNEKFESSTSVEAGLKIAGGHGEFIEIGEKSGRFEIGERGHGLFGRAIAAKRETAIDEKSLASDVVIGIEEKTHGASDVFGMTETRDSAGLDEAIVFAGADTRFGHTCDRGAGRDDIDANALPFLRKNTSSVDERSLRRGVIEAGRKCSNGLHGGKKNDAAAGRFFHLLAEVAR